MTIEQLLAKARADQGIRALSGDAARGAEAYFQAYQYVAEGNPDETRRSLRELAMVYLDYTASPPLTPDQNSAAEAARKVLERLSA